MKHDDQLPNNENSATPTSHAPVTQQDVADACGVGRATVSLALRGDPRISPATVKRIQAAAQALGYHPAQQEVARRLALHKYGHRVTNRVIAVLFPHDVHRGNVHYYSELSRGIMAGLLSEGFAPLLQYTPEWDSEPCSSLTMPLFEQGAIDGIITTTNDTVTEAIDHLHGIPGFANRPVITLVNPLANHAAVMADDFTGAYNAAMHLLSLGHRHILHFIHAPGIDGHGGKRIDGVSRAMADTGVDPATHLHLVERPRKPNWLSATLIRSAYGADCPNEWTPDTDPGKVLDYLRTYPQITAIIGLNDANAIHAWYTLTRAGVRVPEDMSIVGFDDIDALQDTHGANILTSVRVPLYDMGMQAAEMSMRLVRGETVKNTRITLPTELIVRGTTGPAPMRG